MAQDKLQPVSIFIHRIKNRKKLACAGMTDRKLRIEKQRFDTLYGNLYAL
jgi:hypothetical protein